MVYKFPGVERESKCLRALLPSCTILLVIDIDIATLLQKREEFGNRGSACADCVV